MSDELGTCKTGLKPHKELHWCQDWKPLEVAPVWERTIVGGAPHGFGIWIEGKFHPVNIGALGKVITDLQEEVQKLKSELAASKQVAINYEFESAFAAEFKEKLEAARIALHSIGNDAGAPIIHYGDPNTKVREQRNTLTKIVNTAIEALEKTR